MEGINYIQRICDSLVESRLSTSGALLIEGPKWCGKTFTGLHACRSALFMQDPDRRNSYLRLADAMPSRLLEGDKPRLLDEWQEAPVLWDAVRFSVDRTGQWGQYILTGSAVPRTDEQPHHTGTGRISRLRMRPMTLFESGESIGSVSISSLFATPATEVYGESKLTIPDLATIICRGGWPEAIVKRVNSPQIARNYVDAVIETDVSRVDGMTRSTHRTRALLRSYARNISTMASLSTILNDIRANDVSFSEPTLYSYLDALRRIFLIEDLPAWKPSLRSRSALRTSEKRQFVDPSIATAVAHADASAILDDFEFFGFLFESLATRDIRVYTQALDGDVFHYRDSSGLEVDLIIRLHDGRWAAVEVKLGSREIDEGATHLRVLREKVDTPRVGEPAFLMVVTGGEYAYRRKDDIIVAPLSTLCP